MFIGLLIGAIAFQAFEGPIVRVVVVPGSNCDLSLSLLATAAQEDGDESKRKRFSD